MNALMVVGILAAGIGVAGAVDYGARRLAGALLCLVLIGGSAVACGGAPSTTIDNPGPLTKVTEPGPAQGDDAGATTAQDASTPPEASTVPTMIADAPVGFVGDPDAGLPKPSDPPPMPIDAGITLPTLPGNAPVVSWCLVDPNDAGVIPGVYGGNGLYASEPTVLGQRTTGGEDGGVWATMPLATPPWSLTYDVSDSASNVYQLTVSPYGYEVMPVMIEGTLTYPEGDGGGCLVVNGELADCKKDEPIPSGFGCPAGAGCTVKTGTSTLKGVCVVP